MKSNQQPAIFLLSESIDDARRVGYSIKILDYFGYSLYIQVRSLRKRLM